MNSDGEVFASKITCLELLGALVLLATCTDLAAVGGQLRIFIDNQGAVDVYRKQCKTRNKKGNSKNCDYTSSIAKAIFEIAKATGVEVSIEKIKRCSNLEAITADEISKGKLKGVKGLVPCKIPESIAQWIMNPKKNLNWAKDILKDMEEFYSHNYTWEEGLFLD